jgi:hypothetical protein
MEHTPVGLEAGMLAIPYHAPRVSLLLTVAALYGVLSLSLSLSLTLTLQHCR